MRLGAGHLVVLQLTFPMQKTPSFARIKTVRGEYCLAWRKACGNKRCLPRGEFGVSEFRVLVVDDDDDFRNMLIGGLSTIGFADVDDAANGAIALSRCESTTYDCILLDFNMPTMNGATIAHFIRVLQPDVPIIFLTGNPENCEEAVAGAALRTVAKPVSVAEIKGWIRECVVGKVASRG